MSISIKSNTTTESTINTNGVDTVVIDASKIKFNLPIVDSNNVPYVNNTPASTTVNGIVELATTAETNSTDATRVVTPAGFKATIGADTGSSLVGFKQTGAGAVARTVDAKLKESVSVKDFGAVGDGVTDDQAAIVNALSSANGRRLELESGKVYKINTAILHTGNVSIGTNGALPAVIYHDAQIFTPLSISGSLAFTRNLIVTQQIHNFGWDLDSVVGIVPGMLVEVVSSLPWYHDDRGDAKKSELHRVAYVVGNTVFMEDLANDGYNLLAETVTLTFYMPVSVALDNITIRCVHAPVGIDAARVVGLKLSYAYEPVLNNVNTENAANCGIQFVGCYGARVMGGHSHGANNYYAGYGVQFVGSANSEVKSRKFWNCRRGVDVSGFVVISRHTLIADNINHGGGVNSEGSTYGWTEDGLTGGAQFGFGSHGPADHTIYRGNIISRMHSFINVRGRNEIIEDNVFIGRSTTGGIVASFGENLTVKNNKVYMGTGAFKTAVVTEGGANINTRRCDTFVYFLDTYQGGDIIIDGNIVEVQESFMRFTSIVYPKVTLRNNRVRFATSSSITECYLATNDGASAPADNWVVVNNEYRRISGTGDVGLLFNITKGLNWMLRELFTDVVNGEWTPVITALLNCTAATTTRGLWSRVGNRVSFNMAVVITPTIAGTARFNVDLPVSRANFSTTTSAGGTIGSTSLNIRGSGGLFSQSGTQLLDCRVYVDATTATTLHITGSYEL